jgi:glycosyltransferase involved in cell wall biosynthesis
MADQPLASICIPAYNNQDFIKATIEGILNQTYENLEIVITDDKSSDRTVSIIKEFVDPRIHLVQNDRNLGMGENWNKAVSLARGKYVKLVCGDDVIYPECLSRQIEVMERPANAGVALALCNSNVINDNNEVVLRRTSRFGSGRVSGGKIIRSCVRWGTNLIGEPVVGLFRKDHLLQSGMYDPSNPYLIDLSFWAGLLKCGDAFFDPTRLAAFRVSSGSVSTKVGFQQAAYFRKFIRKMEQDPVYQIRTLDVLSGSFFSLQWCLLRNLVIRARTKSRRSKTDGLAA